MSSFTLEKKQLSVTWNISKKEILRWPEVYYDAAFWFNAMAGRHAL
jgi:hypothetical protein